MRSRRSLIHPSWRPLAALALIMACPTISHAQGPEGFGENTTGGSGKPIVLVTNLMDYIPGNEPTIAGSLRAALAAGNRRIHFTVGGAIDLRFKLGVRNISNVTIDGATAPAPGITLRLDQVEIRDASNIILRHIRVRDSADNAVNFIPGVILFEATSDVWLDHVSVSRASDESMSAFGGAQGQGRPVDVTFSWNLIANAEIPGLPNDGKGLLIGGSGGDPNRMDTPGEMPDRISVHHNIMSNNDQRNPQISGDGHASLGVPFVDLRNNIVHDWTNYGTRVRWDASANVVKNIHLSSIKPNFALELVVPNDLFTSGNSAPLQGPTPGVNINTLGNLVAQIAAPAITEHAVVDLAEALIGDGITTGAGALPRDATDNATIMNLAADLAAFLPTCSGLGGSGCVFGDTCSGSFQPTSNFGSLCCVGGSCSSSGSDMDGDGVDDGVDNCPGIPNAGQEDRDVDGVGNVCDVCPKTADPSQTDADADGVGDACDIEITQPLAMETLDCRTPGDASTRPLIIWNKGDYNRFRVAVAWDPSFAQRTKITSGTTLLKKRQWKPGASAWREACNNAGASFFLRVSGVDLGVKSSSPRRKNTSQDVETAVQH